jgi:hypothetical protein
MPVPQDESANDMDEIGGLESGTTCRKELFGDGVKADLGF